MVRKLTLVVVGLFVIVAALKTNVTAQADVQEKNRRAVQAAFDNWRRSAGTVYD